MYQTLWEDYIRIGASKLFCKGTIGKYFAFGVYTVSVAALNPMRQCKILNSAIDSL